ncbi:MAG: 3-deoxy-7-phosphoheptulonate synthase [Candidatus Diapherotrites archaeon]
MIIVLKKNALQKDIETVIQHIESNGLRIHKSLGEEKTLLGVIGDTTKLSKDRIELMTAVEKVIQIMKPYKLISREFHPENTVIKVNGVAIGGKKIVIMAGPCAIESEEQLFETAKSVKESGAAILRASAYKPRSSPYAFQGMKEKGLKLLKKVKQEVGIVTETEVMDIRTVELVAQHVDIIRIGARNMQNFDLLKQVGKINKPIILKRGISATIEEFLLAAEYIVSEGNPNVILCERGIRTFETATRNTLDLSAVPVLKKKTHLPVIVDPSHAAGENYLVGPLSKAAIAVGADGLLVEVHCSPKTALCDGKQALLPEQFKELMNELRKIAEAIGREI